MSFPHAEKGLHPNIGNFRIRQGSHLPEMNDIFMSCYQEALEKHGVVSVEKNRAIFIGSSGAGKSSLKHLLIHNESKEMKTSTPVMETPDVVVVGEHYAVDKGSSTWNVVTPNCLKQSVKSCTVGKHYQECRQYPTSITQPEKVFQVDNAISEMKSDEPSIQKTDSSLKELLEQVHSAFLKEVDSPKEGIKLEKQKFLHLIDSGGQPFFQDVLSLLMAIPSTCIVVFDASKDLDSDIQATYRPREGEELHIASPSETHWEFIQRTLSGMQTMAHKFLYTDCKIFQGAKPELHILFTGTFKDAVKKSQRSDEIVANIGRKFDSLKGKPYYKHITWDQNGRIFLIDNHLTLHPNVSEEDSSYLNHLRGCITGKSTALKVDVPLMWFLLQVITQRLAKKFIKEEALKLFCLEHQYIDEDNANEQFYCLLKLLHFLGFYAYFDLEPTYLKDGTNYVCTDGTAFYHEVSKLLAVQYNPAQSGVVKEFQDRGLVCSPYEVLFKELDICPDVDPAWLLEVLHHIGIAARLGSSSIGGPPSYFIPSSLPYGRADVPRYSSVEPLCFTFVFERDSFSTYCDLPRSVFCRLVVELADQEWRVIPQASDRTCVKFACPKRSTYVYLIEKPDHICCQVIIDKSFPLDAHDNSFSLEEIHRHCSAIRNRLEENLHCITQEIFGVKFQKFAKIVPVLPCSCQSTPHHTAPVDSGALVGSCVKCGKCAVMSPQQKVWFSPLSASEAKASYFSHCQDYKSNI
jgi:GTPase SAR1 family protein